jgi:flagellar assembly protein FliH
MTAPTKFLFDTDFAGGPKKPVEPMITLVEHEVKLAEGETAGHQRGYAQAQHDAEVEANRRIAGTLENIAKSIAAASEALQAIEARLECEAVEVAVAVARKLAPTLVAREPFAEISALASDCFRQLIAAPHIVVRVNDAVYATAKEKLEDIARARTFEGRRRYQSRQRLRRRGDRRSGRRLYRRAPKSRRTCAAPQRAREASSREARNAGEFPPRRSRFRSIRHRQHALKSARFTDDGRE